MPREPLSALSTLAACALLLSCADEGSAASGGDDADAGADTDSEILGDVCANYPAADDTFLPGSVPRNYAFLDATDVESRLCDYADKKLALLVISDGES